jgi:hypothetical protein
MKYTVDLTKGYPREFCKAIMWWSMKLKDKNGGVVDINFIEKQNNITVITNDNNLWIGLEFSSETAYLIWKMEWS